MKMIRFLEKQAPEGYPPSLYLTQQFSLDQLGIPGLLFSFTKNLEEALQNYIRFHQYVIPIAKLSANHDNRMTYIHVDIESEDEIFNVFYSELSFSGLSLMRYYIDSGILNADTVEFMHDTTYDKKHYEDYFGCPVKFNAGRNTLTVESKKLRTPINSSNIFLFRQLREKILEDHSEKNEFKREVKQLIKESFHQGSPLSRSQLAESLKISERTLVRKLNAEGIQFKKIYHDELMARADYLLKKTEMTTSEISKQLGFSSPAGFTRTLKRLTGLTPTSYRKQ